SGQRMRAHHGPVDIIGDMREERRAVTVFESGKNFPDEIRFHSHANSLPRIIARKARWCGCDFQSWRGSTKESDASQICRKRKWARSCCRRSRAQSLKPAIAAGEPREETRSRRFREPPAGARNVLRREVDLFGETHQLPVAGAVAENVSGLPGETEHRLVGAQRVAEQFCGAKGRRPAFQILQQRPADAVALPAVVDRESELEARGFKIIGVTRLADDGLKAINLHGGDDAELVGLADMDEAVEQSRRQLAHGAEEAVVARTRGEAAEIILDAVRIARLDETHGDRRSVCRAEYVRMLTEMSEAQRGHGPLQGWKEAGAPLWRRRRH